MDRLNMSLDSIIKSKHEDRKPVKKFNNTKKVAKTFSRNNNGGGKFKKQNNRNVVLRTRDNDNNDEDDEEEVEVPSRPMKIIEVARPRIIKPTAQSSTSSPSFSQPTGSSVFNRLNKTGTYVIFRNLKNSVSENDVLELCRAVGECKEVRMQPDFTGFLSARALMATEQEAKAIVHKYDGLTLDGAQMTLEILEEPVEEPKPVFNRLNQPTGNVFAVDTRIQSREDTDNNVRSGMFGTALNRNNDKPQGRKVFVDKKVVQQNRNHSSSNQRNRNQNRGNNNNNNQRAKKNVNENDLDADLDNFMSNR